MLLFAWNSLSETRALPSSHQIFGEILERKFLRKTMLSRNSYFAVGIAHLLLLSPFIASPQVAQIHCLIFRLRRCISHTSISSRYRPLLRSRGFIEAPRAKNGHRSHSADSLFRYEPPRSSLSHGRVDDSPFSVVNPDLRLAQSSVLRVFRHPRQRDWSLFKWMIYVGFPFSSIYNRQVA